MKPAHMVAMILSALVIFYPLSSGPVFRAYYSTSAHGLVGVPQALQDFYTPLTWMSKCEPINEFFRWYFTLWMHDVDLNPPA